MFVVIIIGIIFIFTLFNIQIINGHAYRDKSQNKMLRTETIAPARGEIIDRNGIVLATNTLSYDLVIYKVDISSNKQNDTILNVLNILEENGDSIKSRFPINETFDGFNFKNKSEELNWKKDLKFKEDATFNEIIDIYVYRYELEEYKREDALKIIRVRYEAGILGYSLFKGVTIAEDISPKSMAHIEEKSFMLQGIKIEEKLKRYYPYGSLFAHSIGYVSNISDEEYKELKDQGYKLNSNIGKTGIEESFEKYLKGTSGIVKTEVNTLGEISSQTVTLRPKTGNNIALTLDYRLQKVAHDSLVKVITDVKEGNNGYIKHEEAGSGSVVVTNVKTGEILAMVNYPSFDPNLFVSKISYTDWNNILNDKLNPMNNRAISGTYSPGSTFKMLMGVAGLEEEKITPKEKIVDTGIYKGGHNPHCWLYDRNGRTHGSINVSQAIQVSCNVFFYETGKRLGISTINEYAKMFGLGQKTGIEIAGEKYGTVAGDNYNENKWYLGQTLSAAIGQESNSFTPISMVNYISSIANGGTLNRVKLVKNIKGNDNISISNLELNEYIEEYTKVETLEKELNIEKENIEAVRYGMSLVTSQGGTSYSIFKNLNVKVAGKTGTAQVQGKTSNGIFVGFAPYDNPEIAVYAIVEQGGEGTYVANVVKPIFEEYFKIDNSDKLNEKSENISDSGVSF